MRRLLILVVTAAWSIGVQADGQRAAQVSRASATAVVETIAGRPAAVVHLTNHWPAPLEAWQIDLECRWPSGTSTVLDLTTDTSTDSAPPGTLGHGPVLHGETRAVVYGCGGAPVGTSVVIRMLLFNDGSVEGSAERSDRVLAQRERRAVAIAAWIKALEAASGRTAREAQLALEAVLGSEELRSGSGQGDGLAKMAREAVRELSASSDADAVLQDRIAALKDRLQRHLERALYHKTRK